MPRLAEFYGIAIYMYHRDHGLPHFHALDAGQEAVIAIRGMRLLEGRLSPRALALVRTWGRLHREELRRMKWWRIVEVEVAGAHSLDLTFKDGTRKRVHLLPLLDGPVFEPLQEPGFFARVALDLVAGTAVWPNGADIAPETLYELPAATDAARLVDRRRTPCRGGAARDLHPGPPAFRGVLI